MKYHYISTFLLLTTLAIYFFVPASEVVMAQPTGVINPLGDGITMHAFLLKILNALVYILFPVVVIMMVYTGFLFVSAQGNESKITAARQALMWTVVGALVLLGSKGIAMAICETVKSMDATGTVTCS